MEPRVCDMKYLREDDAWLARHRSDRPTTPTTAYSPYDDAFWRKPLPTCELPKRYTFGMYTTSPTFSSSSSSKTYCAAAQYDDDDGIFRVSPEFRRKIQSMTIDDAVECAGSFLGRTLAWMLLVCVFMLLLSSMFSFVTAGVR